MTPTFDEAVAARVAMLDNPGDNELSNAEYAARYRYANAEREPFSRVTDEVWAAADAVIAARPADLHTAAA